MQFKKGSGWKACYDEKTGRYTAETGGPGLYNLWEITAEIFDRLGSKDLDNFQCQCLISDGRRLYMDVNDRCGPPYTVILDDDYKTLCPWADIISSGKVWDADATDAAVEVLDSEKQNRAQRREKRKRRES